MEFLFDKPIFAHISQLFYLIPYNDKIDSLYTLLHIFLDYSYFSALFFVFRMFIGFIVWTLFCRGIFEKQLIQKLLNLNLKKYGLNRLPVQPASFQSS